MLSISTSATPPELGGGIDDDLVAPVRAPDGRALLGLVGGEIGFRDDPAVGLHLLGDAIGNPAFVEGVGAAVSDRAEGLCQVGLNEPIAFLPFAAAGLAEGSDRGGKRRHRARHLAVEPARESCRHREALGEADRRRHDVLPRELAELLVRELHAPHRARHARREIAGGGEAPNDLSVGSEIHRRRRRERRLLAVVERRHVAGRRADDHEAAAADVAGGRVRHGQRKRSRDRRVDGVPAPGEHRGAGIARRRRHADDQAVLRRDAQVGLRARRQSPR